VEQQEKSRWVALNLVAQWSWRCQGLRSGNSQPIGLKSFLGLGMKVVEWLHLRRNLGLRV
jgi:hypothetical protein